MEGAVVETEDTELFRLSLVQVISQDSLNVSNGFGMFGYLALLYMEKSRSWG